MRQRTAISNLGDPIAIVQRKPPTGALGAFDERTGEVCIDPDQPEVGKHAVVLHELLHLVDAQLRQVGITKRRADHRWVESAAPNLLALLVLGGFWKGVSKKELLAFMATMEGPGR